MKSWKRPRSRRVGFLFVSTDEPPEGATTRVALTPLIRGISETEWANNGIPGNQA